MALGNTTHVARQHFEAAEAEVFQAALETVRTMPGWEVVTAHPDRGEIRARSRGRLFSPSMEHRLRLEPNDSGVDISMESQTKRTQDATVDEKTIQVFRVLLEDRIQRGHRLDD